MNQTNFCKTLHSYNLTYLKLTDWKKELMTFYFWWRHRYFYARLSKKLFLKFFLILRIFKYKLKGNTLTFIILKPSELEKCKIILFFLNSICSRLILFIKELFNVLYEFWHNGRHDRKYIPSYFQIFHAKSCAIKVKVLKILWCRLENLPISLSSYENNNVFKISHQNTFYFLW